MIKTLLRSAFCTALALCAGMAQAEEGKLTVQLNKFEPTEGGGCRAFFLFQNQTENSFEGFEMSLAILDGNGVIDRLLSIDAAPLPVSRTVLKLFEIPQISCDNVSEILLHDLPVCKPQNAEPIDCFPILALDSKTSATLAQ
ncbi:hypothetical protein Q5Y75_08345 [Ruegeria sp. 2205SS24-7]|uniref:hypothetical protein n=1 Tax=Ruegeria discodermiae TaxID=3064389 RepID=UPI002741756E|nr:hypothetical protein [Ruegeria sp. 2205SS24-7]MDP5217224.1 hypothetical protein [Ruegeria sp. 2205SS24-7]